MTLISDTAYFYFIILCFCYTLFPLMSRWLFFNEIKMPMLKSSKQWHCFEDMGGASSFRAYTAFLLILGSQSTGSCIHLPYHYKPSRTWVDLILYYLVSPVSGHGRFPKHSGRNIRLFAGSSSCPWQRLVQPTWSGVPPSEGGTWMLSFRLWFDSPPTLLDMSRNSIWVFDLHPSAQGNVLFMLG